jgi:hypothetical protein
MMMIPPTGTAPDNTATIIPPAGNLLPAGAVNNSHDDAAVFVQ